jgi:hypothetical protein
MENTKIACAMCVVAGLRWADSCGLTTRHLTSYGPRPRPPPYAAEGTLNVEVKYAPFASDPRRFPLRVRAHVPLTSAEDVPADLARMIASGRTRSRRCRPRCSPSRSSRRSGSTCCPSRSSMFSCSSLSRMVSRAWLQLERPSPAQRSPGSVAVSK